MSDSALMQTYGRLPVAFERGEGAWLLDTEGRRYLDALSGIAVCGLGHAHAGVADAIAHQARTLVHTSNLYRIPLQEQLAERLCAAADMGKAFFGNSGAEANEAAIKIARLYGHKKGFKQPTIVVMEGAFHGRTMATLTATGNRKVQAGFEPLLKGFVRAPFGDLDAVRRIAANQQEVVAVLVEPIQGEGGLLPLEDSYLRELRAAADEFGLLLVFDEVQTGFGRTGRLFAHQWTDVTPDIMGCAKGIAGGFPCGAILATDAVAQTMTAGSHGSTFGGNPLAMAVANATLDVLTEDGFLDAVQVSGATLTDGLNALVKKYDTVLEGVRGKGLMIGIILKAPHTNTELSAAAREQGLLTVVAGQNVLRMLPPLTIGKTEIDEALDAIDKACASLASAGHG